MQQSSGFSSSQQGVEEHFFTMSSAPGPDFDAEAEQLLAQYAGEAARRNCGNNTEIFLRFHLSDVANQAPRLRQILGPRAGFVSMVGQPPGGNARLALESWHWRRRGQPLKRSAGAEEETVDVTLDNYRVMFSRTPRPAVVDGSAAQTHEAFELLSDELRQHGGTLCDNCLRTWLYCRDIDNNYAGLVVARKALFAKCGLTEDTHYIASTGIEGMAENSRRLVRMDALALFGHSQEQLEYLQALDHMPPTHRYGVTFERGLRVIFGDRSHYYISGTASIDRSGRIMHPGNVAAQTGKMVENIAALLQNHGAVLEDLKQAVVYVRDGADAAIVEQTLAGLLPEMLPRIILKASVCRPGWLVEMDAIGVNSNGRPDFAPLA